MNKSINPYTAFPFYEKRMEKLTPLMSPTKRLIPFQVHFDDLVNTDFRVRIIDLQTHASASIDSNLFPSGCIDNKNWVMYTGLSDLPAAIGGGTYILEIITDTKHIYSHPFTTCEKFDKWDFEVTKVPLSNTELEVLGYPLATIEVRTETGWIPQPVPSPLTPYGIHEIEIKATIMRGDTSYIRYFTYRVDNTLYPIVPAATITYDGKKTTNTEDSGVLIFRNSKDIGGVLYQVLFENRFYFNMHRGHNSASVAETFFTDKENNKFLESTSISEAVTFQMPRIPTQIIPSLMFAKYNDSITVEMLNENTKDVADDYSFSAQIQDVNHTAKGVVTYNRRKRFVGCQENMESC